MLTTYDVVVAGAGPAGLALSGALARWGLSVACVDPALERRWENNTCAWADEIEPLCLEDLCDRIWPRSRVFFSERSSRALPRRYARFDNHRLKEALLDDSIDTFPLKALGVQHDGRGSHVILEGGEKLRATLVVDATGHSHALLPLPHEADTFQNVYGILARVDRHPFELDEMALMDFRSGFLGGNASPPTFLYAMPYSANYAFFEETSLADSPGVPFEMLNLAVPDLDGRVVGVGAAGGFVHPATGWSVSHSLRMAGPVAECIAVGLGNGLPPAEAARSVYRVMWTPELLKMRDIHLRGGRFFTRIGIRTLSVFMRAFFSAPGGMWRVYLSNDCTVSKINSSLLSHE